MRPLLAIALLSAPVFGAAKDQLVASDKEMSKTDREVVDFVLKHEVADVPAPVARRFLELRLELLPEPKRRKALAKKLDIETAVKIFEGKKKGGIRSVPTGAAACKPERYPPPYVRILQMTLPPFEEVSEDEVQCVEKKTNCTEDDLVCVFTLKVIEHKDAKGRVKRRQFFLHPADPIMAKVAECRGNGSAGTNFFGAGVLSCNHLEPTPQ